METKKLAVFVFALVFSSTFSLASPIWPWTPSHNDPADDRFIARVLDKMENGEIKHSPIRKQWREVGVQLNLMLKERCERRRAAEQCSNSLPVFGSVTSLTDIATVPASLKEASTPGSAQHTVGRIGVASDYILDNLPRPKS